jgi:hypothetical protein
VGHSKINLKREVYSYELPHQKIREFSDNLVLHLKKTRKTRASQPKKVVDRK